MRIFNSRKTEYKTPFGAVPTNTKTTFNFPVADELHAYGVKFCYRLEDDLRSVDMVWVGDQNGYTDYTIDISFEKTGIYWYRFEILTYHGTVYAGKGELGEAVYGEWLPEWQLTVYDSAFSTPDKYKGGVIYHIFADRFCRSKVRQTDRDYHENWYDEPNIVSSDGKYHGDDFFGGDLDGIRQKLPYIKNLGVNILYLSPIFKARSNHRYDTGDYMQIDPLLGTEEDFINLVKKADERGIKIILDGVFNHVGDDSIYFNKYGNYDSLGAFQSKESKYYDWFSFEFYPKLYKSWWGILTLPAVNKYNNDYLDYITGEGGVIDKYTKLGIGGWRLDVVDELHSGFVQKIRQAVKKVNPNAVVIGEVWEDASNKIAYNVRREYFLGKELDSVMNYPLKNAILNYVMHKDCAVLSNVVKEQIDHYPSQVLCSLMNILSTHDTFRLLSAVSGESYLGKNKLELSKMSIPQNGFSNAVKRLKIATLLQYTLLGVPSIYYGDEAGMEGYTDPLNRKCFPWGNENLDITAWFKFLGKLRTSYSAFSSYGFKELFAKEGAYVYKRYDKGSEILVAINLSDNLVVLDFEDELFDIVKNQSVSNRVELQSEDFGVFIKKRKNKKK